LNHPGFVPRNHPNAIKKRGVDDSIDDRETPLCVYEPLHAEFRFTLDVAASHINAKCERYCTLEGTWRKTPVGPELLSATHGLECSWFDESVWCNMPFSGIGVWVERAWDERPQSAVLLMPNNRQEQPFWQDMIEPFRDRPGSILTTRFIRKRRPFLHRGQGIGNRTSKNPPFGLVLCIWDRRPAYRG